ncbi:MAG: hypothetical protein WC712_00780 [Candidatus Brocadiia bacterium]
MQNPVVQPAQVVTPARRSRTVLFVVLIVAFAVAMAIAIYDSLPRFPEQRYLLLPAEAKLVYYCDAAKAGALLPAATLEKIPSLARAIANSSSFYLALTQDHSTAWVILAGAPDAATVCRLAGGTPTGTEKVEGSPSTQFDGGCIVEIGKNELLLVLSKNAVAAARRCLTSRGEKEQLDPNIVKYLSQTNENTIFRACGFPGAETPPVLDDASIGSIQRSTKYFTFRAEISENKGVKLLLNLFFNSEDARDFMYNTLPQGLIEVSREKYPFLNGLLSRTTWTVGDSGFSLVAGCTVPMEVIEAMFAPPPAPTPIIPTIPGIPF